MRTTLTIDDDVLPAVKSLAAARGVSLGRAASELIRTGLRKDRQTYPEVCEDSFPVFHVSENALPITLEDVKRLEDVA